MGSKADVDRCENLVLTGIRSPDRPHVASRYTDYAVRARILDGTSSNFKTGSNTFLA